MALHLRDALDRALRLDARREPAALVAALGDLARCCVRTIGDASVPVGTRAEPRVGFLAWQLARVVGQWCAAWAGTAADDVDVWELAIDQIEIGEATRRPASRASMIWGVRRWRRAGGEEIVVEWRALGETGIKVSKWTLGSMNFGRIANPDHDECVQLIHRALRAGINAIDTADVHSYGEAEEIIGRALREVPRDDVVLCGRVGGPMDPANPHVRRGGSRRWLVRAVEDSLRRLQVEHLDVLTLNRVDERTALDETLGALTDLVRAGKVRALGSCTWPAERMVEAQWTSEMRGHLKLRVEQPPYSLLVRHPEAAVLPTAARHGIGVMTWSPLRGGWLTGRYRRNHMPLDSPRARFMPSAFDPSLPDNQSKLDAVEQYVRIAEDAGLSVAHMALAFVARHPAVSTVCIGPRTLEHLDDLLQGVEVELADDVLDALDRVVPPGESIRPSYTGFANHDLLDPVRRRRPSTPHRV